MLPDSKELLGPGAGDLAATPFPLLLHAVFLEKRTLQLELRRNQLFKKIYFEEGLPVSCATNLLHETLGRFLVEQGKIEDEQYQDALAECTSTGARMGETLVQRGLLSAYDLYRMMQRNLALKILDCFLWTTGTWRLLLEPDPVGTPLKMNPAQLILTGCANSLPWEVIEPVWHGLGGRGLGMVPSPPHETASLKLSTKEARLVSYLALRPNREKLVEGTGFAEEEVARRIYALLVLGIVAPADEIAAAASPLEPEPERAAEEDDITLEQQAHRTSDQIRDDVMSLFLQHRQLDSFELLGTRPEGDFASLREAWLAFARRFAPWGMEQLGPEVVEKAEMLFLAGSRAFAELSTAEGRAAALRRRESVAEKREKKQKTEPDFRIRTDLLDASSQFEKAMKLFDEGKLQPAHEHFRYAMDIDSSKAEYRAWAAWTGYLIEPTTMLRAKIDLVSATRLDPKCAAAVFFLAQIREAAGDLEGAESAYKRAVLLDPDNRDYTLALKKCKKARR